MITFSKTRDLNLGPLALQPDTLPTERSGLGRILCKSMGICVSITENIVPHGRHFLPSEKFPSLGNRISLGQVLNCPLEIRFPSGGNFFNRKENAGRVVNVYFQGIFFAQVKQGLRENTRGKDFFPKAGKLATLAENQTHVRCSFLLQNILS